MIKKGHAHRTQYKNTEEYREDGRQPNKNLLMHQPQRNDTVLKDETKYHWAWSFRRWLSFLPLGVKGNLVIILRLRKFGKPTSRTQDKKLPVDVSCGVQGIYSFLSETTLCAEEAGSTEQAMWPTKRQPVPCAVWLPVTPQPLFGNHKLPS